MKRRSFLSQQSDFLEGVKLLAYLVGSFCAFPLFLVCGALLERAGLPLVVCVPVAAVVAFFAFVCCVHRGVRIMNCEG
jgi:hypothetical protein